MTLQLIAQITINAILLGMIYSLLAIGFSVIYGVCNIPFLAIGEIYMVGALLFYLFNVYLELHYAISIVFIITLSMLMAVIISNLFRFIRGNQLSNVVLSLGLGMAISSLALIICGQEPKYAKGLVGKVANIHSVYINIDKLVVLVAAMIITISVHIYLKYTKYGQSMRAVAQDSEAATLQGIDIDRTLTITFILGFIITTLAGALITPIYYIDVFQGTSALMKIIIVVVLGGLGNIPGAIIGGLFLGFVESFGFTFLGDIAQLIIFAIVFLVLIFKPEGLVTSEKT